jgi:hypothetical protein
MVNRTLQDALGMAGGLDETSALRDGPPVPGPTITAPAVKPAAEGLSAKLVKAAVKARALQGFERVAAGEEGPPAPVPDMQGQLIAQQEAEQKKANETGFLDVVREASQDDRVMSMHILNQLFGEKPDDAPAGWRWTLEVRNEAMKGLQSDEERELMDEWGPKGPAYINRARAIIEMQRAQNEVYGRAGGIATFFGTLAAGSMDLPSWVAGLGLNKLLQLARVGSGAAIRAGKAASAVRRNVAENVLSEVGIELANDYFGRVSQAEDYAMATLGAAGLTAVTSRGVWRAAQEQAALNLVRKIYEERFVAPNAEKMTPEQRQATEIAMIETAKKPMDGRVQVIPEDVRAELDKIDNRLPEVQEVKMTAEEFDKLFPEAAKTPEAPPKATESATPAAGKAADTPLPKIEADKVPVGISTEAQYIKELTARVSRLLKAHEAGDTSRTRAELEPLMNHPDFMLDDAPPPVAQAAYRLWAEAEDPGVREQPGFRDGTFNGRVVRAFMRAATDEEALRWARDQGDENMAAVPNARDWETTTLRTLLTEYSQSNNPFDLGHRQVAKYLLNKLKDDPILDNVTVMLRGPDASGKLSRGAADLSGRLQTPLRKFDTGSGNTLRDSINAAGGWEYHTILHESLHMITQPKIELFLKDPMKLDPTLRGALQVAQDALERVRAQVERDKANGLDVDFRVEYGTTNLHEFFSMFVDSPKFQRYLAKVPAASSFGGRLTSAWHEVMRAVKAMLKIEDAHKTAFDEIAWSLEVMLDRRGGGVKMTDGTPVIGWSGATLHNRQVPVAATPRGGAASLSALGSAPAPQSINPMQALQTNRRLSARMYQHARDFLKAHPIDQSKLQVATKFIGSMSDALVMAASKNPIMQMIASLVTESTTGAAGRLVNVAIRKENLNTKLTGDGVLDYHSAYDSWGKRNGRSLIDDLWKGEKRREFDRLVYLEILSRGKDGIPPATDPDVQRAATALEGVFDRSRVAQQEAGTLGADALGNTSRGYIPQALDGRKLAGLDRAEIAALEDVLAQHWHDVLDWDIDFARQFSSFYINRARERAMGTRGVEIAPQAGNSADIIRQMLEEMRDAGGLGFAPDEALQKLARASKFGVGHTRKRLDVDMTAKLPNGKIVLDYYDDDALGLARRYVNRTSGIVALTEAGIHGPTGVRHLRRVLTEPAEKAEETPTLAELEAFDRVTSEILGEPVHGEVVAKSATALRLFTGLVRLGGMGFTQAAETVQLAHHLGMGSLLRGVAMLPKMMGEVGRIAKGKPRTRHILTDIEKWGGDIGMDMHKMIFPLDPPDSRIATYGHDPGLVSRLLTGANYIQAKVSLFRAIRAAQHRMVAEQIVMRAARMIRDAELTPDGVVFKDASNLKALQDMGFTDEVIAAVKVDLDKVAAWDRNGDLVAFDITKLSNPLTAEAIVQAVHRGVGQIIQGTFIGERTKWMHNDYFKLIAQLRVFGITAAEKQWARTRMREGGGVRGYAYAAGILLAQAAMVLPIHLARVHLAAIGREDQDEYLEKHLSPEALARATMNYASVSGLLGDFLDIVGGLSGGWAKQAGVAGDLVGGRQGPQSSSVTGAIPALGLVDSLGRAATGNSTLYNALRSLPFSNLPMVIPIINLTKE